MNGISNYHYQLWLMRLTGSILILCAVAVFLEISSFRVRSALLKRGEIRLSASCSAVLRDLSIDFSSVDSVLPSCVFEKPGTLPLLWSLGRRKALKNVSKEDLLSVPTIGRRTASRIMGGLDASTWAELAIRAKLNQRQLKALRGYLKL
ncbi:MAG: hypothetical protein ACPGQS_12985 [Bradymonadia bacterium]